MIGPRIAILGGGQLGRMFIENALRYDVHISVLDPDPACPCARIASRFERGNFDDRDTVLRFAKDADVVGIEIEHVSVDALEELQRRGKRVVPDPKVLRTIKDKGLQKTFYREHNIPTADFALIADRSEIAAHATLLPAFLKARTGGYDGKGVVPINALNDAARAFDGPCVLEKRADVAMEIGVIVARSSSGDHVVYDPVEMVFDPRFNLVDHLRAPARVDARVVKDAQALAVRVADAFNAPGLYAVELFLAKSGELLVNETAPRAHNSGHHTIEACMSSQFDQLLRIYMDAPLGNVRLRGHAAMINLIGEGGTGAPHIEGLDEVLNVPGTFLHIYGKPETRTGRKMGHVNVVAQSHDELDQAIAAVKTHGRIAPTTGDHQPTTINRQPTT